MHCGICGKPDHNSRFHTKKKQRPTQDASEAVSGSQSASQAASQGGSQAASEGGVI